MWEIREGGGCDTNHVMVTGRMRLKLKIIPRKAED